ncbi:hypothetical protein [Variovorax paradoxus]|uniref:Uncharacterized protein n=1 Tax=Variovorax paradoxus TaxID=34073 RepID=A0A0H2M0M2_VARPD|nr:hypothetical protein [Variovorax paradoxus]KLN55948.1 hypothetical protein VPARA_29830 [Variovorax paradoxus]
MSRYEWPIAPAHADEGDGDDPAARSRYNSRRRSALDLGKALRASRTPQQLPPAARRGRAPGPFAPIMGDQFVWQHLGPATVLGGQAEGNPRVAGRINALCVHELGQRIYAASANGGVWYSKNGGDSWVAVGGLAPTNTAGINRPAQRNACGALEVIFGTNEGDDTVFLGTGEVNSDPEGHVGDSEGGVGILVGDKPAKPGAAADPWKPEAHHLVNNGIYRFARDPESATILVATLTGLYQRPAAHAGEVDWGRPTATPFATLDKPCTDILWTAANGTSPARCWVWVKDGPDFGLWVRANGTANFKKVTVDATAGLAYVARRGALAASNPPTQVWLLNDYGGGAGTAGLFRVTNPASGTDPVAHGVVGVPDVLRNQGFYDIAIAVDPNNANRVVLGGCFMEDVQLDGRQVQYNAAITVADVAANPANAGILTYGQPNRYTLIGLGAHADVHALAFSNAGTSLWTGCDGGVFRSDRPDRPAGFYPRNHGLSISESNYVACHPMAEGHLLSGLQDNGTVQRMSSGVWKMKYMGDGGGIVLNAANPSESFAQYVQGNWNRDPTGGTGPLTRGNLVLPSERDGAAFYSMPANIANTRSAPAAGVPASFSQTLIGTWRLWYSDDFGKSWVTLPTATDPLAGMTATPPVINAGQDSLGNVITACRWQGPDVAWVLCDQRIRRYSRAAGAPNGGGPGVWVDQNVVPTGYTPPPTPPGIPPSPEPGGKAKRRPPPPPPAPAPAPLPISLLDSEVWTDMAPNLDAPPAPGQPPAQHGTLGALYVGTIGHKTMPNTDTLFWFDGTDKWYPTGLHAIVPAPVLAIACRPELPLEVWAGTTVGVWQGVRTDHGADAPTWAWTQRVNGLPEAAVEDLAFHSFNGVTLLRAGVAARGVWELRLDDPTAADRTYLRIHEDDLRYAVPPLVTPPNGNLRVLKKRDLVTDRSWHSSPDIRPRKAPAAMPAPSTLPWRRDPFRGTKEQLRRFQAALRSSTSDPRIVANGIWDVYFSEVLRDHGAPVLAVPATVPPAPPMPALSVARINAAFWNTHMTGAHATREPWGTGKPTEADLYELTPDIPEGDLGRTSYALKRGALKVDIVVQHRGLGARDGADVRVTLLQWIDPKPHHRAKWNDTATWFTDPVPWTGAVNEVLNSAAGTTALAFGAGWSFVGSTDATRRQTLAGQTLDATHAGIATFDLATGTLANNRVILLVAVIRAGADIALAPATLQELALTRPEVAVRSLHVTTT